MKAWSLKSSLGQGYADLYPYYHPSNEILCSECNRKAPVNYMKAHWEEGSDQIGDFTSATGLLAIKKTVLNLILQHFKGLESFPINFISNPRYKRSTKSRPLISFPYQGPELVEIRAFYEIPLHSDSSVEIEECCKKCNRVTYKKFVGIEEKNSSKHRKRIPGMGFFFNAEDRNDYDFFKPKDTGFILCTDDVKNFIIRKKFTNIDFLEVGEFV